MLSLSVSSTSASVCVDSQCSIFSLDSPYSESDTYTSTIGGQLGPLSSIIGFVWSFVVLDSYNAQGSYFRFISTSCLTVGCSYTMFEACYSAVNDPDVDTSGCISLEASHTSNAEGIGCPQPCASTGGCSGGTCLVCECPSLSCMLREGLNVCWCPRGGIATSKECRCPIRYAFDGNVCISCERVCISNNQGYFDGGRTESGLFEDLIGKCNCYEIYYGTRPLASYSVCYTFEIGPGAFIREYSYCKSYGSMDNDSGELCTVDAGYLETNSLILSNSCKRY